MHKIDAVSLLIKRGNELLNEPYKTIEFTGNPAADELLNNLEKYPHAFVLACVMDRQIDAERAWMIPYKISQELKSFNLPTLLKISIDRYSSIFTNKSLHRFNPTMAKYFFEAVHQIGNKYSQNASKIWADNPKSATVVRRFLEFQGVGVKIATMAANILSRQFKIPMQDRFSIDISPDVHVKRVFTRLGFIESGSTNDELIYCARELNPTYPGIFDLSAWEIGHNWCRPKKVDCLNCYMKDDCSKQI
jgi:endonuclease III